MAHEYAHNLLVENFPAIRRSLRVAVVSETYPPEVNGVAVTLAKVVDGLRAANHAVQLIRLRQGGTDAACEDEVHPPYQEVLMRGFPIPRYPELRMGMPSKSALPLAKGAFIDFSLCSMTPSGSFKAPISSWITCLA